MDDPTKPTLLRLALIAKGGVIEHVFYSARRCDARVRGIALIG